MNKLILFFAALLWCAFLTAQDVVRSEKNIITTIDTAGVTYYQIATVVEYDNGRLDSLVSERKDSASFVDLTFNEAHNTKLPIRQAIKALALKGNLNTVFNANNQVLQSITGNNYFQIARQKGFTSEYEGYWRIIGTVDTVSVDAFFSVNANGVGSEVDNLTSKTPVPSGLSAIWFPYSISQDFVRLNGLFPIGIDIAYLIDVIDDNNPNDPRSLRRLWANEDRTVRMIFFPNIE